MDYILRKYLKYNMRYDRINKVLYIYDSMLVKDFCRLKVDLDKMKIKLNNIILEGK